MAGDWIKMNSSLWDHPKVSEICDILDCSEAPVIGALFRLWSIADQHSEDGVMPMTMASVDRKTNVHGFADALRTVGWLNVEDNTISIPEWESHHGQSAKRRSEDARRKAKARAPKPKSDPSQVTKDKQPAQSVRKASDKCPQDTGQNAELEKNREEKNREDKQVPPNPHRGLAVDSPDLNSETPAQFIEKKVRGLQPDWQGPLSYNEQSAIVREIALFESYDWDLVKSWFDSRPEKLPSNRMKFIESGGVSEQTRAREWRNGFSKAKEPWQIEKEIQRLETEIEKIRVNEKSLNRSRGHLMSFDQHKESKRAQWEKYLQEFYDESGLVEEFEVERLNTRRQIEETDHFSAKLKRFSIESFDAGKLENFAEWAGLYFDEWDHQSENPWIDPNGLTPEAKLEIEILKTQIEERRTDLKSAAA